MKFLRWAAVLPGAILGAILATFPLRIILYQTITGSGIVEPYPETPERLLTPLVMAAAFVWIGAKIAPTHNFATAIALFSIWIILLGIIVALALVGADMGYGQLYLQDGGFTSAGALVGAILGLLVVRIEIHGKEFG